MTFLQDKRRAGIIAVLATLIGAAALFFGIGAASAAPPNNSACRTDGFGDATVDVPGVMYATADTYALGSANAQAFWVCLVPPDVGFGVDSLDPDPSNPAGWGFLVKACAVPAGVACHTVVGMTGAEVGVPTTGTTTSGSTPGGSAGTGTGTCVYVDGTTPAPGTTCRSGLTVAGVNVATGDAKVSTRTVAGGCVGAAGNPCITTVPSGAAVTVGGGDSTNDTVNGDVAVVGPVNHDIGKTCVVNVLTDCTTP